MKLDDYFKLQRKIVPNLRFNQELYEEAVRGEVTPSTLWLDAGCGWHILPEWRDAEERRLVQRAKLTVGVDVDEPALAKHRTLRRRVVAELSALPFADGSFTLLTCNMVMEHSDSPGDAFAEFARVLRPGGKVVVHTPNMWSYYVVLGRLLPWPIRFRLVSKLEQRAVEDVYPTRYRANTLRTLRSLANAAGLVEERHRFIATAATMRAGHWLLAALELFVIRFTLQRRLRGLRASMIGVFIKPSVGKGREKSLNTEAPKSLVSVAATVYDD
jgi:ubiquinone/menaquinone biosynthesis C-methylase UbiE